MSTQPAVTDAVGVAKRHWLLLGTSALVVPLVLLCAVELVLRIAGVGYPTSLLVPCTVHGKPASCYNLFFAAPFFPAGSVQSPRLYSIPVQKPAGTYRIVILGESAAMGDPDPAYGFSRYLEVMLRERYPSMNFEVVNTGSVAINSHIVLRIAKELADEKPDLFIIYSGNNEVVGPYGPGTVLTSSGMSIPVVRSSMFLRSTRIGQLVTKLGAQRKDWRGMQMFLDKQVRANSPLMEQVYRNYERNLRDTVTAGQRAGASVIVATAATNLEDCAPFASLHRENLKEEDLRSWTALVQQGSDLEAAGSGGDALKQYQAAAKIDDEYAELDFRMARAEKKLGDLKSAKVHFARARDLDTLRFRADGRINDINRFVPGAFTGVGLVDTEAILSDASADGIIGGDMIYEHVHLTPAASYLLAKAIFQQVARKLPVQPVGTDVPQEAECERFLALTGYDRSRIAREMLRRSQEPPFTNQLNHAEQILRFATEAQSLRENPNDTALQYQWALARMPDDPMLHLRYGLFLFGYNRAAAAEQLAQAQPWDGFPVFLPDGTQVR
jgi:tetratricopeptide (TPR) repeat protein